MVDESETFENIDKIFEPILTMTDAVINDFRLRRCLFVYLFINK